MLARSNQQDGGNPLPRMFRPFRLGRCDLGSFRSWVALTKSLSLPPGGGASSGFVSSRATRPGLWSTAPSLSSGLHDVKRNCNTFDEARAPEGGRDDLVMTAARTEQIAEFAMLTAKAFS